MKEEIRSLIVRHSAEGASIHAGMRREQVEIDSDLVLGLAAQVREGETEDRRLRGHTAIRLNLSGTKGSDATFIGLVQWGYARSEDTTVLGGPLLDITDGTFTIVIHKGLVGVQVFAAAENYAVYPSEDGGYVVSQEAAPEEFRCEVVAPGDAPLQASGEDTKPELSATAVADDDDRVDVLIVYTPNAKAAAGGATALELAMYEMEEFLNKALANSLPDATPPFRARFVAIEEVPNEVAGSLETLRAAAIVRQKRDAHRADLVVLIRTGGALAGQAFSMCGLNSPAYYRDRAFALVRADYIRTYRTVVHEIGHLFGCQHDLTNVDSCSLYADSRGHYFQARDSQGVRRWYATIMSYPHAGNRVPHFSNPEVLFRGVPTGTAERNNARAIRDSRRQLARYRAGGALPPGGGTPPGEGPTITISGPPDGAKASVGENVTISVKITDPSGVRSAELYWAIHRLYLPSDKSGSWWQCSRQGDEFTWTIRLGSNAGRRAYHVRATSNAQKTSRSADRAVCVCPC